MSATDVVYSALTALFAAAAVRALRRALTARRRGWRSRVDHLLHTVMALAMTVMPWSSGHGPPGLPQAASAFFAAAALWFPLTATGCCRRSRPAAIARRLPYSAGMAAMAWMTLAMAGSSHEPLADGLPSGHRAVHLGHSAAESEAGAVVTGVLALYLLGYGLWSLTRDMPTLRGVPAAAAGSTGARGPYGHFWDGTTAWGTVIMLLVHP